MNGNQVYVIAQQGPNVSIVFGDFSNKQVGDLFERHPALFGHEPWKIIKTLSYEEQKLLDGLQVVMGTRNFELLWKILDIKVEIASA